MLAGVLLAWLGGELLVRGTVGVARWAGWPASIVAATVADKFAAEFRQLADEVGSFHAITSSAWWMTPGMASVERSL